MIVSQQIEELGENVRLLNCINTDDAERENWRQSQQGKGFIHDSKGHLAGRLIANIPVEEAAMLEAQYDLDYLSFSQNGDKNAFRRLLQRFPHWRCAEGGI